MTKLRIPKDENLCDNCLPGIKGSCCYQAIYIEGQHVILGKYPCQYLDFETKLCTVYEDRLKYCITVEEGLKNNRLPRECLYVKKYGDPKTNWKSLYLGKLTARGLAFYHYINNLTNREGLIYT